MPTFEFSASWQFKIKQHRSCLQLQYLHRHSRSHRCETRQRQETKPREGERTSPKETQKHHRQRCTHHPGGNKAGSKQTRGTRPFLRNWRTRGWPEENGFHQKCSSSNALEITHEDTTYRKYGGGSRRGKRRIPTMARRRGTTFQETRGFTQKQTTNESMQNSTTTSPPGRFATTEPTPKTGSQEARSVSTTPERAKTTRTRGNCPKGNNSPSPSTSPSTPSQ